MEASRTRGASGVQRWGPEGLNSARLTNSGNRLAQVLRRMGTEPYSCKHAPVGICQQTALLEERREGAKRNRRRPVKPEPRACMALSDHWGDEPLHHACQYTLASLPPSSYSICCRLTFQRRQIDRRFYLQRLSKTRSALPSCRPISGKR